MAKHDFATVETWIFDLDNTLYHPSARLFDQINRQISQFMMDRLGLTRSEADRMRGAYWRRYGATLRGLMAHHGVDPVEYLEVAHDIDLSALKPDKSLAEAIGRLPGRRIIHTNGARAHAERVLAARGLTGLFDEIYGIDDKALIPKPDAAAYGKVVDGARVAPDKAVMIEDDMRNLEVPKSLGMRTVWLCREPGRKADAHVDHRVTRLTEFLERLTEPQCQ